MNKAILELRKALVRMIKININAQQLKEAIDNLPTQERARLVNELNRKTWEDRFRQLLARIDARLKRNPISQREITKIVEQARNEYYARCCR